MFKMSLWLLRREWPAEGAAGGDGSDVNGRQWKDSGESEGAECSGLESRMIHTHTQASG